MENMIVTTLDECPYHKERSAGLLTEAGAASTDPGRIHSIFADLEDRPCGRPLCQAIRNAVILNPSAPIDILANLETPADIAAMLGNPCVPLHILERPELVPGFALKIATIGPDREDVLLPMFYIRTMIEKPDTFGDWRSLGIRQHFRQACKDRRIPDEWLSALSQRQGDRIRDLLSDGPCDDPLSEAIEAWTPYMRRFPEIPPFLEPAPACPKSPHEVRWPEIVSAIQGRPWRIPKAWSKDDMFAYLSEIGPHLAENASRLETILDADALEFFHDTVVRFNAALLHGHDAWGTLVSAHFKKGAPPGPPAWLPDLGDLECPRGHAPEAGKMTWEQVYPVIPLYATSPQGQEQLRKYFLTHMSECPVFGDGLRYLLAMSARASPEFRRAIEEALPNLAPEASGWERILSALALCSWKTWTLVTPTRGVPWEIWVEIGIDDSPDGSRVWSADITKECIARLSAAVSGFNILTPWNAWKAAFDACLGESSWLP